MCGWAVSQGDLGMGPVDFKQGEVEKECFRPELAEGAGGGSVEAWGLTVKDLQSLNPTL